jgi:hypothetical protein
MKDKRYDRKLVSAMTDRGKRTLDGSDDSQVVPARPSGKYVSSVKFRALGNGKTLGYEKRILSLT